MPIFAHVQQKTNKATLRFPDYVSAGRKISPFHLFILRVLSRKRQHPFLTMQTKKTFNQPLISMNFINMQKNKLFHHFVLEI